jgi:hypothetical protein
MTHRVRFHEDVDKEDDEASLSRNSKGLKRWWLVSHATAPTPEKEGLKAKTSPSDDMKDGYDGRDSPSPRPTGWTTKAYLAYGDGLSVCYRMKPSTQLKTGEGCARAQAQSWKGRHVIPTFLLCWFEEPFILDSPTRHPGR